jgi:hypothetical protein
LIGDSYELLFQVKQQGDEALVKIASSLSEIDKVGRTASSTVDNMGAAGGRASGNLNQLKATIDGLIAEIRVNTLGLGEMTVALDRVSSSSTGTSTGLRGVGAAARGLVGDAQAATAALRGLDGSLNMQSAGRFLSGRSSLTSSRKIVPPSASSKRPSRRCAAPGKAPFSWPNNSDEISVGASAAQFTLTKARPDRWDRLWTARAMSSLPVPVSPVMRTVESVGATLATRDSTALSNFEVPTISSNMEALATSSRNAMFSR